MNNKSTTNSPEKKQARQIVAYVKLLQQFEDFDYKELEDYIENSIRIAILEDHLK
jgi:hypothetical protein